MSPIKEWKHPVTGITHKAVETGWDPEVNSYPTLYPEIDTGKWTTCVVPVPEERREEFLQRMIRVAKGLSEITGSAIEWHYMPDACNPFGDWGTFKVKK